MVRSCIKYGIANHAPRWNHSCIKMYATMWNNAPRSVQLVARNCKCSKGLNDVPCVARSCIKYGIANHTLRWHHSCIKMHATIWNNAPCSVQLVARNRRKDDWQNYIETKVVTRCGGSWTHNTGLLADLPLVYTTHYCAPPYIPDKTKSNAFINLYQHHRASNRPIFCDTQ